MKRLLSCSTVAIAALMLAASVRADVKTQEKSTFKLEGFLGRMVNMFGGAAAKNGIVSTVALKGDRMSRINDVTGRIVDLNEQKVYDLDVKKKEYRTTTFDELRQRAKEARDKAEKEAKNQPADEKNNLDQTGKQIDFDIDVKETGQHKSLAGYDTHEVVVTLTGHEKDKKIEDSGGFIMTSDMWMAPKIAALDEIAAFEMKFFQTVYGEALGIDPQQAATLVAAFPSFSKMSAQMQSEGHKLNGTPLFTTLTFESMKSADDMKASSTQSSSSGGGISGRLGGMLANRMRGGGQPQQRSTVLTSTVERLSVTASASAEDVAIPAGYKEKK